MANFNCDSLVPDVLVQMAYVRRLENAKEWLKSLQSGWYPVIFLAFQT